MKQRTTFLVLDLAILGIEHVAPLVATVRRSDKDLADPIRRAASSIALNIAEGDRSLGESRIARFSTAAGSTAGVRAALRVAAAWGYLSPELISPADHTLDRIAAILYRQGARF